MGAIKEKIAELTEMAEQILDSGVSDEELDEFMEAQLSPEDIQFYHAHKDIIFNMLGWEPEEDEDLDESIMMSRLNEKKIQQSYEEFEPEEDEYIEDEEMHESLIMPRLVESEDDDELLGDYRKEHRPPVEILSKEDWLKEQLRLKNIRKENGNFYVYYTIGSYKDVEQGTDEKIRKYLTEKDIDNKYQEYVDFRTHYNETRHVKDAWKKDLGSHFSSKGINKNPEFYPDIIKKVRLDYDKMSQYDLKKEVDKALDAKDYDTLRKIHPYLKEGFLKNHVSDCLNENLNESKKKKRKKKRYHHHHDNPFFLYPYMNFFPRFWGFRHHGRHHGTHHDGFRPSNTGSGMPIPPSTPPTLGESLDEGCNCGGKKRPRTTLVRRPTPIVKKPATKKGS